MLKKQIFSGKFYAVGESLLDLIAESDSRIKIVPGGSMLNTCVSLGRLGVDTYLISEVGDDKAGEILIKFLNGNGVQTDFYIKNANRKTAIALAFLDENKNATYSFYTDSPLKMELNRLPDFNSSDFLLFGSSYAVKPERVDFVRVMIKKALDSGSFIVYDPNYRKSHASDKESRVAIITQHLVSSTLVKGSDEDFYNLFGMSDPLEVYNHIVKWCKYLVVTSGSTAVHLYTPDFQKEYIVPQIVPVSTIGAGDTFSAGLIYGLLQNGINRQNIGNTQVEVWDKTIGRAIRFASEVCLSPENYLSSDFARANET